MLTPEEIQALLEKNLSTPLDAKEQQVLNGKDIPYEVNSPHTEPQRAIRLAWKTNLIMAKFDVNPGDIALLDGLCVARAEEIPFQQVDQRDSVSSKFYSAVLTNISTQLKIQPSTIYGASGASNKGIFAQEKGISVYIQQELKKSSVRSEPAIHGHPVASLGRAGVANIPTDHKTPAPTATTPASNAVRKAPAYTG